MVLQDPHDRNLPQDMSRPARSVSHRVDVLDGEPLAGLAVHAGSDSSERPLPQEIEHSVSIAQFAHVSADIAYRGALHYCRELGGLRSTFNQLQHNTAKSSTTTDQSSSFNLLELGVPDLDLLS